MTSCFDSKVNLLFFDEIRKESRFSQILAMGATKNISRPQRFLGTRKPR